MFYALTRLATNYPNKTWDMSLLGVLKIGVGRT